MHPHPHPGQMTIRKKKICVDLFINFLHVLTRNRFLLGHEIHEYIIINTTLSPVTCEGSTVCVSDPLNLCFLSCILLFLDASTNLVNNPAFEVGTAVVKIGI